MGWVVQEPELAGMSRFKILVYTIREEQAWDFRHFFVYLRTVVFVVFWNSEARLTCLKSYQTSAPEMDPYTPPQLGT